MPDDNPIYDADPIQVYVTEVGRIPALDRSEEIACIEHARSGDEMAEASRTRLMEANLHLVVALAERYRNERVHILDLIQNGNEGLIRAAEDLADCPPDSFTAHATKRIERAFADFVAAANG